jgi:hypothetical protein
LRNYLSVIYFSLENIKEELRPQIYILEWGISFKKEERKNDQDFEAWKQPSKQKSRPFPLGELWLECGNCQWCLGSALGRLLNNKVF